jgi:hypothetical protein
MLGFFWWIKVTAWTLLKWEHAITRECNGRISLGKFLPLKWTIKWSKHIWIHLHPVLQSLHVHTKFPLNFNTKNINKITDFHMLLLWLAIFKMSS